MTVFVLFLHFALNFQCFVEFKSTMQSDSQKGTIKEKNMLPQRDHILSSEDSYVICGKKKIPGALKIQQICK